MRRGILLLSTAFLMLSVTIMFGGIITEPLADKMAQSAEDELIRVNVVMKEQGDFAHLTAIAQGKRFNERRMVVAD